MLTPPVCWSFLGAPAALAQVVENCLHPALDSRIQGRFDSNDDKNTAEIISDTRYMFTTYLTCSKCLTPL